jgi:hypothetical protein
MKIVLSVRRYACNSSTVEWIFMKRDNWNVGYTLAKAMEILQEDLRSSSKLHYVHTYSMEQSPSWKANRFSASQEIPRLLRIPKVHYRIHRARHLSLSWASSTQSIPLHPTSLKIHLNIILPSTPRSPKRPPSLTFPHQNPVHTSPLAYTCNMSRPSHSSRFYHPHNIGWGVQTIKLLIVFFLHSPVTSFLLGPNILLRTYQTTHRQVHRTHTNRGHTATNPKKTNDEAGGW